MIQTVIQTVIRSASAIAARDVLTPSYRGFIFGNLVASKLVEVLGDEVMMVKGSKLIFKFIFQERGRHFVTSSLRQVIRILSPVHTSPT